MHFQIIMHFLKWKFCCFLNKITLKCNETSLQQYPFSSKYSQKNPFHSLPNWVRYGVDLWMHIAELYLPLIIVTLYIILSYNRPCYKEVFLYFMTCFVNIFFPLTALAPIPFPALLVGYLRVLYQPSLVCHKVHIKMSPKLYDLGARGVVNYGRRNAVATMILTQRGLKRMAEICPLSNTSGSMKIIEIHSNPFITQQSLFKIYAVTKYTVSPVC